MAELDKRQVEITDLLTTAQTNDTKAVDGIVRAIKVDASGTTNIITVTLTTLADRGTLVSEAIAVVTATADVSTNLSQPIYLVRDVIRSVATVNKLDGTNTYGTADIKVIPILDDN